MEQVGYTFTQEKHNELISTSRALLTKEFAKQNQVFFVTFLCPSVTNTLSRFSLATFQVKFRGVNRKSSLYDKSVCGF